MFSGGRSAVHLKRQVISQARAASNDGISMTANLVADVDVEQDPGYQSSCLTHALSLFSSVAFHPILQSFPLNSAPLSLQPIARPT